MKIFSIYIILAVWAQHILAAETIDPLTAGFSVVKLTETSPRGGHLVEWNKNRNGNLVIMRNTGDKRVSIAFAHTHGEVKQLIDSGKSVVWSCSPGDRLPVVYLDSLTPDSQPLNIECGDTLFFGGYNHVGAKYDVLGEHHDPSQDNHVAISESLGGPPHEPVLFGLDEKEGH